MLRAERTSLSAAAPSAGGRPESALDETRIERDHRVTALHAGLQALAEAHHEGFTESDRQSMRELITARIDSLSGIQAHTVAGDPQDEASAPDPTGQVWNAVTDVLATERRALAALAPELSAQTNARIGRDETEETASYPELAAAPTS